MLEGVYLEQLSPGQNTADYLQLLILAAHVGAWRGVGGGGAILTKVTRVIIDRQNFMAETTPPPPTANITLSAVWRLGGSVRG